jgi:nucleoside-diphosphate-sugar epimerase
MNRRILVIGSRGYLGQALSRAVAQNPETTVYGFNRKTDLSLPTGQCIQGDLVTHDWATTLNTLRPHVIYHVAGASASLPFSYQLLVYAEGTRRLLQAVIDASQRPRIIIAGSAAEYGVRDETVNELSVCRPDSEYGIAKLAQTEVARIFARRYGLAVTIARIFNVYGGSNRSLAIASMAAQIAEAELKTDGSEELKVYNLRSCRDFIHIDDVTDALIALSNRPKAYENERNPSFADQVYNVATGHSTPLSRVLDRLLAASTRDSHELQMNGLKMHGMQREEFSRADIRKISQHTGWFPKIALSDGLERELNFWRSEIRGKHPGPMPERPYAPPSTHPELEPELEPLEPKPEERESPTPRRPSIFDAVPQQLNANPAQSRSLLTV